MEKNNEKNKERVQNRNLKPIKPGETRNPNGRPLGQRNYATIMREAMIKLASLNGKTAEELEEEIHQKALALARKGDYRFYKDINDRLHGTAQQNIDLKSDGKALPTPIYQGMSIKNKKVKRAKK